MTPNSPIHAARRISLWALFALLLVVPQVSAQVVISQVYGGGGNSGATLRNDFIELFNRGTAPVTITGWSVQYASATGSSWQRTDLAGTLQPGQYYLVQQAMGNGGTTNLPAPDASGNIAMAAGAGKVALVSNQTLLSCSTGCLPNANIRDFVGFGSTANSFEGSGPTATLSNTTAALRADNGCTDTNNNSADFAVGTPNPRNTSASFNICDGPPTLNIDDVTKPEGDSGTTIFSFTVSLSSPAGPGGVSFNIATQDDSATTEDNDYVAKSESGHIAEGQEAYTFDVTVNGDTNIEDNERFFVNVTGIVGAVPGDVQGAGTIINDDFAPSAFDVVISQVYGGGGNSGATLRNDFIELFNYGTTTVSLSGWSVQYASAGGSAWQVTPLNGSIAPGGYYLVRQAAGAGGTVDLPTPDAMGTSAMSATGGRVALSSSSTPFTGGSCATGPTLLDLVGYGSTSCFEGSGPTAPTSNTTAALRKRGGCLDSNNNSGDFSISQPNPRNSASATRSCEYTPAFIHAVQGAGLVSPFAGQDVTIMGLPIVTGIKTNGFFMQAPESSYDTSTATSEGIFVFTATAPMVAVGDAVTVKGTATEFFNLTQIESTLTGDVTVNSSGNPLPAPVALTTAVLDPNGGLTQLEHLEGMRVHADSLRAVAPTNDFGEISTVLEGVARPMREPGIEISHTVPPDPISGMLDCCIPRWDENPERIMVDTDGLAGAAVISVTSHATLANVTGPLDFSFGSYKILPQMPPTVAGGMSAVPVPDRDAEEFTVASFNIENFNNNMAQRRKAALAIRDVMRYPDIIGHAEIANLTSLEALAAQVNDDAVAAGDPSPMYEAELIPGTGSQHVGFLVRTSRFRIDSVTQEQAFDTYINPNTNMPDIVHDRPPLVLWATFDASGLNPRPVIVVVNHLRSFIDIELVAGDGPRVRAKRTAQAEKLAELLQELQTGNPTTPIISVGDYNAFQFNDGYTDPISVIKGTPTPGDQIVVGQSPDLVDPDFINLTDGLPAGEQYTFVFEGTPQALDHVIVNNVAHSYLQRYAIARSNADFPESAAFAGDLTRPERNSDHDMPVAYFAFPPPVADMEITKTGPASTSNGSTVTYTLTVANNGPDNAADVTVTDSSATSITAPSGWTCTATTCTASSMTSGATATFNVTAATPCAPEGTVIVNTAEVTSAYSDSNTANNSATASVVLTNPPPVISGLSVDKPVLDSRNHKMVDVAVNYTTSDNCGTVTTVLSVTSNQPVIGKGDGNTSPDWEIVNEHHVRLRAERAGNLGDRIYTITATATDSEGAWSSASVTVKVSANGR